MDSQYLEFSQLLGVDDGLEMRFFNIGVVNGKS